jgi:hypothetical protein
VPRLLKIKELQERRKALAQESDVYRESLKLQIQNLQLYSVHLRQRFNFFRPSNPVLMLIGPLIGGLFQRRKSSKMSLVTTLLFAWKMFGKVRALIPALLARRKRGREEDAPASAS